MANLLVKQHKIVTYFHSSSTKTAELIAEQKATGKELVLVQDVETRWTSLYDMVCRSALHAASWQLP